MGDSETRRFTLLSGGSTPDLPAGPDEGLADVLTLQRPSVPSSSREAERGLYQDSLAEYCWARDVAGLAATTLKQLVQPVIEVCTFYDVLPWELTLRMLGQYFAGPGKRGRQTVRKKITNIHHYFAFLEQRHAGEIRRRFAAIVESRVDAFNQPRHRGDFGLRIPPSRPQMEAFFAAWRQSLAAARKYPVAVRNYVMAKITYISGVRACELCRVRMGDLHWDNGQWGRFLVRGKGARGSGPREREAFMFAEGRELLWWYVEEVRGLFCDDPLDPYAPLFSSERLPAALGAVPAVAPEMHPDTFRRRCARRRRSI